MRSLINCIFSLLYTPYLLIWYSLSMDNRILIIEDINCNYSNKAFPFKRHVYPLRFLFLLFVDSYFHEIVRYRVRNLKLRHFFFFKHRYFTIPRDVEIGGGIFYNHPYATILNAKRIGRNLRIKNNITIGNKNDDESLRPIIGDHCTIGVGAIIIGDVVIGDNVTIGAGAVVTKNIPNNCVVAGVPAKIIRYKN